jgi:hypothetical protein
MESQSTIVLPFHPCLVRSDSFRAHHLKDKVENSTVIDFGGTTKNNIAAPNMDAHHSVKWCQCKNANNNIIAPNMDS